MARNSRTVNGHKAAVLIDKALDDYTTEITAEMFKAMSKAGKMAKRDVVNASPEGPNGYAKGWTIRTKREKYGCNVLIYNKTHPGLTHLLENSHIIANQNGTHGRTSPGHGQVIHIGPAREAAEDYLLDILMDMFD
jgi:hypothetical protein